MGPTALPIPWAQATGLTPAPNSLAPLALRRWFDGLTLSSPELVPSFSGFWWGLAGLAALLGVAIVLQGPVLAIRQLFDLPGHVRLVSNALGRLGRSSRVVVVTIVATVISWTASQAVTYNWPQGKDDLILLTKSRSLGDLAVEGGILAGLTPLRDVAGLGDNVLFVWIVLVIVLAGVDKRWGLLAAFVLYVVIRNTLWVLNISGSPLRGYFPPEVVAIPLLMVLADGLVLAWILAELRDARREGAGDTLSAPKQALALMPGAALACFVVLPARYVGMGVLLSLEYLPLSAIGGPLGAFVRWVLGGGGLIVLQAASLATLGLAGAVCWSGGTLLGAVLGYLRLLKAEAGHLVAVLALASLAAGIVAAVAYAIVLALPPQTWVLAAADSYSHYATLPIGLLTLAALVELGERTVSTAKRAGVCADTTAPEI